MFDFEVAIYVFFKVQGTIYLYDIQVNVYKKEFQY